ncbi:MAG: hypothetical protein EKK68_06950 [Candidatus Competibacteraceae bacterium]|nr:MAG: hypothetical protein EKK68_06950 [Candidatus Competibacteraceae bacterium]
MNPATTPKPYRDLSASFQERTTGSRVEFAQWREANPDFTHPSLMENWHRIRVAWSLIKSEPKRAKK